MLQTGLEGRLLEPVNLAPLDLAGTRSVLSGPEML